MDTIELVAERWETPELAAEVRSILDAIDAPPTDAEVLRTFQKILYRRRYFDYDARGQIILTCRCILESEGNEGAFREPFVSAVLSTVSQFADRGLELVEAFDQINLVGIWDQMKALEYFLQSEANRALASIVRNKLRRILSPPQPEPVKPPSAKERITADKIALASSRAKVVERNVELGRKLAALRDEIPNNQKFGAAVRKQFDLHDSLYVAEVMRVARLYGSRPEIYGAVGWRALVELASTTTPEAQREKLEARILDGERISGTEVIRARLHPPTTKG
jgi:hypothetical protein